MKQNSNFWVSIINYSCQGAVSQQVVEQMASGAIKASKADYAIAVSGIAGPDGGTEQNPLARYGYVGWDLIIILANRFLFDR